PRKRVPERAKGWIAAYAGMRGYLRKNRAPIVQTGTSALIFHPTSSRPATGRARRILKTLSVAHVLIEKPGSTFPGHALARALDGDEIVAMPAAASAATACWDRAGNVVAVHLAQAQSLPVFV